MIVLFIYHLIRTLPLDEIEIPLNDYLRHSARAEMKICYFITSTYCTSKQHLVGDIYVNSVLLTLRGKEIYLTMDKVERIHGSLIKYSSFMSYGETEELKDTRTNNDSR